MTDTNHVGDINEMVGDAVAKCESCGVPWAEHMGIMGVCATNAQLRKERDEARRERDLAILLNEIDEIGRLRIENAWHSERDEARRERDEAIRERDEAQVDQRLIDELWDRRTEMADMKEQIKRLREERDEARREVCEFEQVNMKQAHEYAAYRGWDCFKEDRA